jgi:tetratricopeptide (TPR) repeat protein
MAHFLLGEIDLYQGKSQAAVDEFQKELAINPTVWLVYWRLGDAYVRLNNLDEAEKVLKESIWLNESSSGAYILLGEIALKKGDSALAAGWLLAGAAKPAHAEFEIQEAEVEKGEVEIQIGQSTELVIAPALEYAGPLPAEIQNITQYAAGVVSYGKIPDAAKAFINFISTPAAVGVFMAKGYEPG